MVLNKADLLEKPDEVADKLEQQTGQHPLIVSAKEKTGIDAIRQSILHRLPELNEQPDIVGDLANEGDVVLLVMPQDIQAPKGRLILPQVQTLRELLDKKCITLSCTTDQLDNALKVLSAPPYLIITDSPVIPQQYLPLCAGLAIKSGMKEWDALKAITINAAKHIGIEDRVGSLEIGKDADILVMEGSCFEVSAQPEIVIIDGKVVA